MKRQILAAVLLLIVIMVPTLGIAEDSETVMLAKTLYTLGDDSYETMLYFCRRNILWSAGTAC